VKDYDIVQLPVKDIQVDETWNVRGRIFAQSIEELVASINEIGLQTPVIVWLTDSGELKLVAGFRRMKAIKYLKHETVLSLIRTPLTEQQARVLNLIENLERQNLNMLEEARGIEAAFSGVGIHEIAKKINRPSRWVHARRRLLTMPDEVQQLAAADLLSAKNLEVIFNLPTEQQQIDAANEFVKAKEKTKKKFNTLIDPALQHSYVYRRTKEEIRAMIRHMLISGVEWGMPRALAWALGMLKSAELEQDITEQIQIQNERKAVQRIIDEHRK